MILFSNKDMDGTFVARCIAEHNLNPNPKAGFHADENYWKETARWKRVLEPYDWGTILFISDRTRNSHATIVCVGKLDVENGRVSTQGGWNDIKPDWYKELAMELRNLKRGPIKLQVPSCLGFRRPDYICDGGRNTQSNKMEPPCAWRDRCISFQSFCETNNRLQEDVLKGKSPEQIIQMTTRLLEGKPTIKPQAPQPVQASQTKPSPSPKATVPKQAAPAQDPGTKQAVYAVVADVASDVAAATGFNLSVDRTKGTAGMHDLYLVDRTENSDYISIYQSHKPKPRAIASFRLRSRVGVLVQLPIPVTSTVLLQQFQPEDVKEWRDGAFLSAVREIPLEGDRIDKIKAILTSVVQQMNNV